jgi:hypothetical protein
MVRCSKVKFKKSAIENETYFRSEDNGIREKEKDYDRSFKTL